MTVTYTSDSEFVITSTNGAGADSAVVNSPQQLHVDPLPKVTTDHNEASAAL